MLCAEAYPVTVEALKPPDSDLDDETREALDEGMSRCNEHSPASGEEVVRSPSAQKDDEPTQDGEFAGALEDARSRKRRRT